MPNHIDAITFFARAGYAARGVVYLLVGGLTALAVLGQGGGATGSRGALRSVLAAPLGDFLLLAIAVGLVGYSLWRCIQAIKDPDHHGSSTKGVAIRLGLMASSISHLVLAGFTVSLLFTLSVGDGGSQEGTQGAVGWLMSQPFGRWLVGLIGLTIAAVGVAHGIKAWKTDFDHRFDMPADTRRWAFPMFRFGLMIRGIVFMIVGALFVVAAYRISPEQAGGTSEALDALRAQPFGKLLLGIVALGLTAFGLYSLMAARYRRVDPTN